MILEDQKRDINKSLDTIKEQIESIESVLSKNLEERSNNTCEWLEREKQRLAKTVGKALSSRDSSCSLFRNQVRRTQL